MHIQFICVTFIRFCYFRLTRIRYFTSPSATSLGLTLISGTFSGEINGPSEHTHTHTHTARTHRTQSQSAATPTGDTRQHKAVVAATRSNMSNLVSENWLYMCLNMYTDRQTAGLNLAQASINSPMSASALGHHT
jgi:hypothetical protein